MFPTYNLTFNGTILNQLVDAFNSYHKGQNWAQCVRVAEEALEIDSTSGHWQGALAAAKALLQSA
jgi:hypothetical protein